jgi:outer membrane receptor protein involved in Fe transport
MYVALLRSIGAVFFTLCFIMNSSGARAAAATAPLSGTVTKDGAPVPHAAVRCAGNNLQLTTTTDDRGRFVFPALALGTYDVEAGSGSELGRASVDLGSSGATVALALPGLKQIGRVAVVRSQAIHGSGADQTLNSTALTRLPNGNSFPEVLIQLPGAVRGANGVVHINGDHGVIDYQIDGVALPQALNRDIGSELNLNDIAFVDVIEGAYPAQYGLKFGSVLNLSTKAGTGAAGFDGNATYGSYGDVEQTLGYHVPLAGGGGASFAFGSRRTARGLDPPNFGSPHDSAASTNEFARFTLPAGHNDFTNVTLSHSYGSFQIPNDVDGGQPAETDDNETQEDTFVNVQYRHALGSTGALSFGPALKISRIRDFGDPSNDFAYGQAIDLGGGGTSTDCATALTTGNYGPTTCGYSLADDRTALDYIFQTDYSQTSGKHLIRAGIAYDGARVLKNYAVTLQPNNFLAPIVTPGTPNAATTVTDNAPNIGNTYQSYVQDTWRMSDSYELEYGLRYDFFSIRSTDFAQGFGAFSPRIKLTRSFGPRTSIYAYVGRFFEPFSLENVSPVAAQQLNLPLQAGVSQFDLKPERDTQLEFGGHVPVGTGSLGFRVWQKNANDLIDDTQVGVTLLHQDINYVLGRLSQQSLSYVEPLARNGRAYASIAHTVSLNKGCETQLLAPCFGAPDDYTPADHDQSYSITGGVLLNDRHDGWFSADGEYGSGLSSGSCPDGTPGNCKRTPHIVFAAEKGVGIAPDVALTFGIQNIFNDRYYVTLANAQGDHYAPPRTFSAGLRFGR